MAGKLAKIFKGDLTLWVIKYNSEKIKLIQEVELIIIDEISMVRSDIIDFIDNCI